MPRGFPFHIDSPVEDGEGGENDRGWSTELKKSGTNASIPSICRDLGQDVTEEVDLTHRTLTHTEQDSLFSSFSMNSSLRILSLRGCELKETGVIALVRSLSGNSLLTELDVADNAIGDAGCTAIANAITLGKSLVGLQSLNLDHNGIGDRGGVSIATMLEDATSLLKIRLRANSLGSKSAVALAKALQRNRRVQELNLQKNSIGPKGASSLAKVIPLCRSLVSLELKGNQLDGTDVLDEIAEACEVNAAKAIVDQVGVKKSILKKNSSKPKTSGRRISWDDAADTAQPTVKSRTASNDRIPMTEHSNIIQSRKGEVDADGKGKEKAGSGDKENGRKLSRAAAARRERLQSLQAEAEDAKDFVAVHSERSVGEGDRPERRGQDGSHHHGENDQQLKREISSLVSKQKADHKKISELERQVRELEASRDSLQSSLEEKEAQMYDHVADEEATTRLRTENKDLHAENRKLKSENRQLKKSESSAKDDLADKEEKIKDLELSIQSLEDELDDVKIKHTKELAAEKKRAISFERKISKLESEIESLRSEPAVEAEERNDLEDLSLKYSKELAAEKKRADHFERKSSKLESEADRLLAEIDDNKDTLEEVLSLKEKCEDLEVRLEMRDSEIAEARAALESLEAKVDEEHSSKTDLELRVSKLSSEKRQIEVEAEERVNELMGKLAVEKEDKEALEKELRDHSLRESEKTKHNLSHESAVEELEASLAEERLTRKKDCEAKDSLIAEGKEREKYLQEGVRKSEARIKSLKAELDSAQSKVDVLNVEVEELRQLDEKHRNEANEWKSKYEDIENTKALSEDGRVEELERLLKESKEEVEKTKTRARTDCRLLSKSVKDLETKLSKAKRELEESKSFQIELETTTDELRRNVVEMKEENDTMKTDVKELTVAKNNLEETRNEEMDIFIQKSLEIHSRLSVFATTTPLPPRDVGARMIALLTMTEEVCNAYGKSKTVREELESQASESVKLKGEVEMLRAQNATYEGVVEEKSELKENVDSLEKQNQALTREKGSLQVELKQVRQFLADLRETLNVSGLGEADDESELSSATPFMVERKLILTTMTETMRTLADTKTDLQRIKEELGASERALQELKASAKTQQEDIDMLRKEKEMLNNQNMDLEEQISKGDVSLSEQEYDTMQRELTTLKENCALLQGLADRVPQLESMLSEREQAESVIRQNLEQAEKEKVSLEDEISGLKLKQQQAKERLKTVKTELSEQYEEKADEVREKAQQLEEAEKTVEDLRKELSIVRESIAEVDGVAATLKEENKSLYKNLEAQKGAHDESLQRLESRCRELEDIAAKVPELEKQIVEREAMLKELKDESESQIEEREGVLKKLKDDLKHTNSDKSELSSQLESVKLELEEAKGTSQELSAKVEEMEALRLNLDIEGNKSHSLEAQVTSLNEQLENANKSMGEVLKVKNELKTHADAGDAIIRRMADALVLSKALSVEESGGLDDLSSEAKGSLLQKALSDISARERQSHESLLAMKEKLASELSKLEGVEKATETLTSERDGLMEELELKNADLDDLRCELMEANNLIIDLRSEMDQIAATSKEVESLEGVCEDRERQVKSLEAQLEECRSSLGEANVELYQVKKELSESQAMENPLVGKLKQELEEVREQMVEMSQSHLQEREKLQSEIKSLRNIASEVERKEFEMKTSSFQLQDQLSRCYLDLSMLLKTSCSDPERPEEDESKSQLNKLKAQSDPVEMVEAIRKVVSDVEAVTEGQVKTISALRREMSDLTSKLSLMKPKPPSSRPRRSFGGAQNDELISKLKERIQELERTETETADFLFQVSTHIVETVNLCKKKAEDMLVVDFEVSGDQLMEMSKTVISYLGVLRDSFETTIESRDEMTLRGMRLEKELEERGKGLAKARSDCRDLKIQLGDLVEELEEKTERLKEMEELNGGGMSSDENEQSTPARTRRSLAPSAPNSVMKVLDQKIEELTAENTRLKSHEERIHQLVEDVSQLEVKIGEMEAENMTLTSTKEDLEAKLGTLKEELAKADAASLESAAKEVNDALLRENDVRQKLQKAEEAMRLEVENHKKTLTEQATHTTKLQHQLNEALALAEEQSMRVNELSEQNEFLTIEAERMQDEARREAQEEVNILLQELSSVQQSVGLGGSSSSGGWLSRSSPFRPGDDVRNTVKETRKKASEIIAENSALKAALEKANSVIAIGTEHEDQLIALRTEKEALLNSALQMEQQQVQLQEETAERAAEVTKLQKALQKTEELVGIHKAESQRLVESGEQMKGRVETLEEECARLTAKVSAEGDERRLRENKLVELEDLLKRETRRVEEYQRKCETAEEALAETKRTSNERVSRLETQMAEAIAEEDMKRIVAVETMENEKFKREQAEEREREWNGRLQAERDAVAAVVQERDRLVQVEADLREQAEGLQAEVEEAKAALAATEDRKREVEEKSEAAEKAMKALEEALSNLERKEQEVRAASIDELSNREGLVKEVEVVKDELCRISEMNRQGQSNLEIFASMIEEALTEVGNCVDEVAKVSAYLSSQHKKERSEVELLRVHAEAESLDLQQQLSFANTEISQLKDKLGAAEKLIPAQCETQDDGCQTDQHPAADVTTKEEPRVDLGSSRLVRSDKLIQVLSQELRESEEKVAELQDLLARGGSVEAPSVVVANNNNDTVVATSDKCVQIEAVMRDTSSQPDAPSKSLSSSLANVAHDVASHAEADLVLELKTKLDWREQEMKSLETHVKEMEETMATVQNELRRKEIVASTAKGQLNDELQRMNDYVASIRAENSNRWKEAELLEKTLRSAVQLTESRLDDAQSKYEKERNKLVQAEERIASLEEEQLKGKSSFEGRILEKEKELQVMATKLQNAEREMELLNEERDAMLRECDEKGELEREVNQLRVDVSVLKAAEEASVKEVESLSMAADAHQSRLAELKREIEKEKLEKASVQNKLNGVQVELHEKNDAFERMDILQKEMERMEHALSESRSAQNEIWHAAAAVEDSLRKELSVVSKKVGDLEREKALVAHEAEEHKSRLIQYAGALEEDLRKTKSDMEAMRAQKFESAVLTSSIIQKATCSQCDVNASEASQHITLLTEEKSSLYSQINELQRHLAQSKSREEVLKKEVAILVERG